MAASSRVGTQQCFGKNFGAGFDGLIEKKPMDCPIREAFGVGAPSAFSFSGVPFYR
jgi:hypothetical protein